MESLKTGSSQASGHYHSHREEKAEILSPLNLTPSKVQINSQEASACLSVLYVLTPLFKIHLLPEYCLELRTDSLIEKVAFRAGPHVCFISILILDFIKYADDRVHFALLTRSLFPYDKTDKTFII